MIVRLTANLLYKAEKLALILFKVNNNPSATTRTEIYWNYRNGLSSANYECKLGSTVQTCTI